MTETSNRVEAWLDQLGRYDSDLVYHPGHERMQALFQACAPQVPRLRIRVAGTNGKGSTAFFLAHALQAAGLKVGLYTSPHIQAFHERIRINGSPAGDKVLLPLLEKLLPTAQTVGASYFEVATALALSVFAREPCECEILEAGVGARLDATTAVSADMALITPIGMDHQAWLGDSLAEIATEKSYAMHGCRWVLSAPQSAEVAAILQRHCSSLRFVDADNNLPALKLSGNHQRLNASLAYAAVLALMDEGFVRADPDDIRKAIGDTFIPGRLQHIRWGSRSIWLDCAHNMHAIEALLSSLPRLARMFDVIFVFSRPDRNLAAAIKLLRPFACRLAGSAQYAAFCDDIYPDLESALAAELAPRKQGSFLILGSFRSVGAGLTWLKRAVQ